MKKLKNWDKRNWLSSKKYIKKFHTYLKSEVHFNQKTKILDIGCGRANIISFLQKKYKFKQRPIGIDIINHKDKKSNITYYNKDAIQYLKDSNLSFDLILIKQTIHFFNKKDIKQLLNLAKNSLCQHGKIIILTLKIKKNQIPCFKKMKNRLVTSLNKDKSIVKLIKNNFIKYKINKFNYKVSIPKRSYVKMIKERYISCLLELSEKEIKDGILEIQSKFKNKIHFNDILECVIFKN